MLLSHIWKIAFRKQKTNNKKDVLAKVLKSIRKTGLHWQRVFKKKTGITTTTTKHYEIKLRILEGRKGYLLLGRNVMSTLLILPWWLHCCLQHWIALSKCLSLTNTKHNGRKYSVPNKQKKLCGPLKVNNVDNSRYWFTGWIQDHW